MGSATAMVPDDLGEDFVHAPELEDIAARLINRHPRFRPLSEAGIRIAYCERLGEPSGQGEDVMAKCQKAPALWRDLSGVDLVIWAWRDVWRSLTSIQREALIAHELCHPFVTEKGTLKLLTHDLEEFAFVAAQYGAWDDGIRIFSGALASYDESKVTAIGDRQPRKGT